MATCSQCGNTTYRYTVREGKDICYERCAGLDIVRNVPGSMFPFTTTNLSSDGSPVRVQSIRHLRQLENQHGVASIAFNTDSKNWDDAPQTRRREYA